MCGACGTNFRRLRVLDHLQIRRDRAAEMRVSKGAVPKLSVERVVELDALDGVARTSARQGGHSHVIAQLPTLSGSGRAVGRLTC